MDYGGRDPVLINVKGFLSQSRKPKPNRETKAKGGCLTEKRLLGWHMLKRLTLHDVLHVSFSIYIDYGVRWSKSISHIPYNFHLFI